MSVVQINGVEMPKTCHECEALGFSDIVGLVCENYSWEVKKLIDSNVLAKQWLCPLKEISVVEVGDCEDIVRCKDCRYYHPTYCEMWSKFGTIMTAENGFCYWGKEKKDD